MLILELANINEDMMGDRKIQAAYATDWIAAIWITRTITRRTKNFRLMLLLMSSILQDLYSTGAL